MPKFDKVIAATLLPEFDLEMAGTRRTLERVPLEAFGWKPHPKSFAMGDLATHLASIPHWMTAVLGSGSFDVSPGGETLTFPRAASPEALLRRFDQSVAEARAALAGTTDAAFAAPWSLLANGELLFTMPRIECLRTHVLSHLVHHRAQLGVYLRLKDLPVPALYGPSADEQAA
jgi:uncharacterized damage-inducible protein DinB